MTKEVSIPAIERATGRSWADWQKFFAKIGADTLSHQEMAKAVYKEIETSVENVGWWAQNVTIAYEQQTGKRIPGQRIDGSHEISVAKTLIGSREAAYTKVVTKLEAAQKLNGQIVSNARTSTTPVRSYWRCNFADGTKLEVAVEEKKGQDKAMLSITNSGFVTKELSETARVYWKQFVADL